jgi:hypothetical protein
LSPPLYTSRRVCAEINDKIRQYETDERSNANRKEFAQLERQYRSLRRDADALNEELEIASMDPKDAHTKVT